MKHAVSCNQAAPPCASYSQAVISQGTRHLYLSSLGPYAADGNLPSSAKEQILLLLRNIKVLLEENNFCLHDVVQVTVYLRSEIDREAFNAVYTSFMPKPWPARSVLITSGLDHFLEISLVAAN